MNNGRSRALMKHMQRLEPRMTIMDDSDTLRNFRPAVRDDPDIGSVR